MNPALYGNHVCRRQEKPCFAKARSRAKRIYVNHFDWVWGSPISPIEGSEPMKRVGIYLRVSTNNGQTTDNQRRELEAVARQSGWNVIEVFEDNGVSGAKGRDKRPAFD